MAMGLVALGWYGSMAFKMAGPGVAQQHGPFRPGQWNEPHWDNWYYDNDNEPSTVSIYMGLCQFVLQHTAAVKQCLLWGLTTSVAWKIRDLLTDGVSAIWRSLSGLLERQTVLTRVCRSLERSGAKYITWYNEQAGSYEVWTVHAETWMDFKKYEYKSATYSDGTVHWFKKHLSAQRSRHVISTSEPTPPPSRKPTPQEVIEDESDSWSSETRMVVIDEDGGTTGGFRALEDVEPVINHAALEDLEMEVSEAEDYWVNPLSEADAVTMGEGLPPAAISEAEDYWVERARLRRSNSF